MTNNHPDTPPSHVLVTGSAGFIGSAVARLLLDRGVRVTGIDTFNDAYDPVIKRWRHAQLVAQPGFTFYGADITDFGALLAQFAGERFDAVINLAARAGVRASVRDPWAYMETNATGTLNLLELCARLNIPRFVLASSSSLYGTHNPIPYQEGADTSRPLSPYAASKVAAEALCASYNHLHGISTTIFRYFTVYGPAGRPDMSVFRFIQWISEGVPLTLYGDGLQERDFTYIDDIARGTVGGLQLGGYNVINLGSDRPRVLRDLIRLIEAQTGEEAQINFKPAHPADVPATWADISRARALLQWEPTVTLEEGIARAIAWYREHRDWASQIATQD